MERFIYKQDIFKFVGYANGIIFIYKNNLHVDTYHEHSQIKDYNDFHNSVKQYAKYMLTTAN